MKVINNVHFDVNEDIDEVISSFEEDGSTQEDLFSVDIPQDHYLTEVDREEYLAEYRTRAGL